MWGSPVPTGESWQTVALVWKNRCPHHQNVVFKLVFGPSPAVCDGGACKPYCTAGALCNGSCICNPATSSCDGGVCKVGDQLVTTTGVPGDRTKQK